MVTVVVFEFSGMRCQPLRRALTESELPCTASICCSLNFLLIIN
ncbi:acetyltransferase [Vibrio cholerae]|nr:acetyltransferase [Vibrio cholerae]